MMNGLQSAELYNNIGCTADDAPQKTHRLQHVSSLTYHRTQEQIGRYNSVCHVMNMVAIDLLNIFVSPNSRPIW